MHTDPYWQSMVRTTRRWKYCSAQWQLSPMRGTQSSCEASLGCRDEIAFHLDLPLRATCHLRLQPSPHMLPLHTALNLHLPACGPTLLAWARAKVLGPALRGP